MHALDLDVMEDLGDRARALFDLPMLRAYTAAIVGRLQQRIPFGASKPYLVRVDVPQRIAWNDSDDRALLVYTDVDSILPIAVSYGPSDTAGSNGFAAIQSQSPAFPPRTFVLLPGEMLFVRATNAPATMNVTTEWY